MTFNRETTILQVIWNTISSASSFLSFMERTDRLGLKDMTIVPDASLFVFHSIEHEISLSNNATLIQSELIRMFFITYDKREPCFCSLRAKILAFECTFRCCTSFKKDMATDLDRD